MWRRAPGPAKPPRIVVKDLLGSGVQEEEARWRSTQHALLAGLEVQVAILEVKTLVAPSLFLEAVFISIGIAFLSEPAKRKG